MCTNKFLQIMLFISVSFQTLITKGSENIITTIEHRLEAYYRSQGVSYYDNNGKGKFGDFCENNGFDDDAVKDELESDFNDCLLVDFDKKFPGTEGQPDKVEYIYNMIKGVKPQNKKKESSTKTIAPKQKEPIYNPDENRAYSIQEITKLKKAMILAVTAEKSHQEIMSIAESFLVDKLHTNWDFSQCDYDDLKFFQQFETQDCKLNETTKIYITLKVYKTSRKLLGV
ncbi:MAG: hypothetical protein AAF335_02825 [Bacteroidota bacterium]